MNLVKNQKFKTDKGQFTITGLWWNGETLIAYDITNSKGETSYTLLATFLEHENRIEYINN